MREQTKSLARLLVGNTLSIFKGSFSLNGYFWFPAVILKSSENTFYYKLRDNLWRKCLFSEVFLRLWMFMEKEPWKILWVVWKGQEPSQRQWKKASFLCLLYAACFWGHISQSFPKGGVGGRGLATHSAQNTAKILPQNCVLLLTRGHRKKGAEKGLESVVWERFPCANPFCPPTPFRNLWIISSKAKGPGEKGAPRNHPESSSQTLANFECRFPYDSYGMDRAPSWPFLGEGFWGNIRRPLVLPAPLFYCWN